MTRLLRLAACCWAGLAAAAVSSDAAAAAALEECPSSELPRIAYLILVHNADTLEGCQRLVDAVWHEDHTIYVHFDTKMKPEEYAYEWKVMAHGRRHNMRKLSEHDLKWGSWLMLAPWFSVAQRLTSTAEPRPWDYLINLSGDSFPVLTPEPLRRTLHANGRHLNYVTCSTSVTGLRPTAWSQYDPEWHKRKAFPFPIVEGTSAEAYYGSQWMVVTRDFVEFVVREKATEGSFTHKLAQWFEHGSLTIDTGRQKMKVKPHIPDEIFFPTVLMNSARFNGSLPNTPSTVPPHRLPSTANVHYVRMDEHYPWSNAAQRYASPLGASTRSWGPYYLGAYDLANVKASQALFVRKVSSLVDENLLRLLPVASHALIPDLQWPSQLPPRAVNSPGGSARSSPSGSSSSSGSVPATAPGSSSGSGQGDSGNGGSDRSSSDRSDRSRDLPGAVPPAPAPGPDRPGVRLLAQGPVGRTNPATGCVDVAESVHCPPKHPIDPLLVATFDLPVGVGYGG